MGGGGGEGGENRLGEEKQKSNYCRDGGGVRKGGKGGKIDLWKRNRNL